MSHGAGRGRGGRNRFHLSSAFANCPISAAALLFSHQRVSPDVHDQPSAIFSVVHGLHVHHSGLNSRLVLWEKQSVSGGKPAAWSGGDNPLCFRGFNDLSGRKHKGMLALVFSHSNTEKITRESHVRNFWSWEGGQKPPSSFPCAPKLSET